MNREIKFRAWHQLHKEIVYFSKEKLRKDAYQQQYLCNLMHGDYGKVLMQFTGLQDIKGNDIYEGDVVYIAGYGNYICEFPFLELYEAMAENDIGEILGNTYENMELVK